jgi:hypothetical protein
MVSVADSSFDNMQILTLKRYLMTRTEELATGFQAVPYLRLRLLVLELLTLAVRLGFSSLRHVP